MSKNINFVQLFQRINSFISTLDDKTNEEKIIEIGKLQTEYLLLKKQILMFETDVKDNTIVDEYSSENYYIKKFYLDIINVLNKFISRFDAKYNNWVEDFLERSK